jgi:hypothetical protein
LSQRFTAVVAASDRDPFSRPASPSGPHDIVDAILAGIGQLSACGLAAD